MDEHTSGDLDERSGGGITRSARRQPKIEIVHGGEYDVALAGSLAPATSQVSKEVESRLVEELVAGIPSEFTDLKHAQRELMLELLEKQKAIGGLEKDLAVAREQISSFREERSRNRLIGIGFNVTIALLGVSVALIFARDEMAALAGRIGSVVLGLVFGGLLLVRFVPSLEGRRRSDT